MTVSGNERQRLVPIDYPISDDPRRAVETLPFEMTKNCQDRTPSRQRPQHDVATPPDPAAPGKRCISVRHSITGSVSHLPAVSQSPDS